MAFRTEIVKSFTFEAAHHLLSFPEGHRYRRLHGHSFRVEVWLTAEPAGPHQWIVDFAEIEDAIGELKETLDHSYLNEIDGLEQPTLEVIGAWISQQLEPKLPALSRVSIYRDSCGEACHLRLPSSA